ncbi:MAG: hypothetical protein JW734_01470 [Candidatus Omnitrophica bacterium]|nr:hypothetical protein [Candidatus Omnitrophota bacterium]
MKRKRFIARAERHKLRRSLFFIFCIAAVSFVYAQEEVLELASLDSSLPAPNTSDMKGSISLDLKNIDVVEALKFLAMKAEVNIVTTNQVEGRVSLSVRDTPIKDIFDVMLRANDLAYDKKSGIYNVMTEQEYKALYGKNFSDIRKVKIINLAYAIPEQIFNLCDTLKSDVGRVLVSPESGTVVLMDSEASIAQIEEAIKSFEERNVVKAFNINYAKAEDVAAQLKTQLEAKKVGSVRADERTNQVLVQTLPERMRQIEELIKRLDRKTREVLIEAKIIKVKLTDDLTEDVEWEGLFDVAREHGLTYLGSTPFASVQAAADPWRSRKVVMDGGKIGDGTTTVVGAGYVGAYPFSGTAVDVTAGNKTSGLDEIHLGIVGKHDFDIIMKFFKEIEETNILATPKITITDDQEAKIHVGEKQAYVTTTTTTGQTTSTVSEEVTFVDVGTQLYITPNINEEGYITLKIKTEVSSVVSVLTTPSDNKIPIIDTSLAETTVMAKSGSTIVIGGLRGEVKGVKKKTTPFLGSIPFLGKFFTSNAPHDERTELLIMITPTLISGDVLVGERGEPIGTQPTKSTKGYYREGLKLEAKEEKEVKFKSFKPER